MGPLSNSLAPMSYSGVDFILENSPSKSYALLESDSDVDVNHLHETVSNVFKRNGHHQHLDSSTKRCQNSVRKAKALSALSSLDVSKTKLKNTKKCLDLYFGRSKHNNCHENTETKVVRGTLNGSYDTESSEITIPTFQQTPPKLVHGNESPTNGVSSLLTLFQSPTSTTCPQKRNHVNTEECNEQPRKRTKLSDSNTKTDERRQCNNCQNSLKSVISEVQASKVPSLLNLFQSPSSSNQP
uniref:Uncharacterized protein n=2 Tax=Ciona intestinalis TaxID=7719 RepID=F6RAG4_CIOIN